MLSTTATFSWTAGSGIQSDLGRYRQHARRRTSYYSGLARHTDLHRNDAVHALPYVSGLPTNGSPSYVRLWVASATHLVLHRLHALQPEPCTGRMVSPGRERRSPRVGHVHLDQRQLCDRRIWLDVGTTIGGTQTYFGDPGAQRCRGPSVGLPINGAHVYARLWSLTSLGWSYTDYSYMAAAPTPGRDDRPRTWRDLPRRRGHVHLEQRARHHADVAGCGHVTRAATCMRQARDWGPREPSSGLPVNGTPVYVRLWSLDSSSWRFNDYTYTASTTSIANMTSPADGSTLGGATTFMWTNPVCRRSGSMWERPLAARISIQPRRAPERRERSPACRPTASRCMSGLWSLATERGAGLDRPYTRLPTRRTAIAFLTDPCGHVHRADGKPGAVGPPEGPD